MEPETNLIETICTLVVYLIASVVKDNDEFQEWGIPFAEMVFEAQFGREKGNYLLMNLVSKFCPLVGHGMNLILHDGCSENYTFVYLAEDFLTAILREVESEANFESGVKSFIDNFLLSTLQENSYDARARIIARRICDILNVSSIEFGKLEASHWQYDTTNFKINNLDLPYSLNSEQQLKIFSDRFNKQSKHVPTSSLLTSFRLWRIAFVAAGGGALMAASGRLAAPAIMNVVLPLACASTTFGQVSFALNTLLSCAGLTSFELLIPGIMSSYGATIAMQRMIHRTAPLKEFALLPLHITATLDSSSTSEDTNIVKTSHPIGAINDNMVTETSSTFRYSSSPAVYILVCGHLERGIDPRLLWGADNFAVDSITSHTSTVDNKSDRTNSSCDAVGTTTVTAAVEEAYSSITGTVSDIVNKVTTEVCVAAAITATALTTSSNTTKSIITSDYTTNSVSLTNSHNNSEKISISSQNTPELLFLSSFVNSAVAAAEEEGDNTETTPASIKIVTDRNNLKEITNDCYYKSNNTMEHLSEWQDLSLVQCYIDSNNIDNNCAIDNTRITLTSTSVSAMNDATTTSTSVSARNDNTTTSTSVSANDNTTTSTSVSARNDATTTSASASARNGWWRECVSSRSDSSSSSSSGDAYLLHWEPAILENLNESFQKILVDKVYGKITGMIKKEILKFTPVVPAFQAAASLPLMVLSKIKELDDPWVVAMDRAKQAGKLLAKVLLAEHGIIKNSSSNNNSAAEAVSIVNARNNTTAASSCDSTRSSTETSCRDSSQQQHVVRRHRRPVTLVGYGMGARLIFHCLETLAAESSKLQDNATAAAVRGIVENAVLIGTPVGTHQSAWSAVRNVVAGRLINCYATNDWLLALLYRSKTYDIGVAGLYPIVLTQNCPQQQQQRKKHQGAVSTEPDVTSSGSSETTSNITNDSITKDNTSSTTTTIQDKQITSNNNSVTSNNANEKTPIDLTLLPLPPADIENVDVTHLIASHSDYPSVLPTIMKMIQLQ